MLDDEEFNNDAKASRSYTYIYILKDQYSSDDTLMDTLQQLEDDASSLYDALTSDDDVLLPSSFPEISSSIVVTQLD